MGLVRRVRWDYIGLLAYDGSMEAGNARLTRQLRKRFLGFWWKCINTGYELASLESYILPCKPRSAD